MKKRALFILCAVVLFLGQANPTYTLKEPDQEAGSPLHAEKIIQGRTLNVVKAAINKSLVAMGWKILSAGDDNPPLPAFSLAAVMYPSSDPGRRQGLFVDIEMKAGNATVIADWYVVANKSRPKSEAVKFYDAFFGRLAEALK